MKKRRTELRFRSRSEHTLDAKGRLNIPSRFREVLSGVYTETLIVTNWEKSLKAYPVEEWERVEEVLLTQGKNQKGLGSLIRYVISGVTICQLDKQGRILLPSSLRDVFSIDSKVILNGMLDHFEIWNKDAWQNETKQTQENFNNFEQGLSSLGIL